MTQVTGPELPGMQFVKFLGAGGFADVFLYERDMPRIKVAVKIMKPGALTDAQRRQFTAEADTMALLAEHPFIVPVLGAGESADGRPYLVMTYYPSSDLAARVARDPMSIAEALRYGIQLASAVETAHRSGVIHRDIKPSNILLSSYGVMGLSDFGIAGRPLEMGHEEELGISLPWSPREIVIGESNGSVQSDVYSLAATVWHLMMGRAPFYIPGGDNTERSTFTRIVHEKPQPLSRPDAPPSLERLLQQAMSKDPAYRPQTALELAQHFQRVEQELRLARTEIVVLDHMVASPPPDLAAGATELWRRGAGPTGPEPGPSSLTMPGVTSPGAAAAPAEMSATELKPPPRVIAQDPLAAPRTQPKPVDPFDRPTDLRPPRVSPTAEVVAPMADDGVTGPRWKLMAAAAALLAAAVGGGFLLTSQGGSGNPQDLPSQSVDPGFTGGGSTTLEPITTLTVIAHPGDSVTYGWQKVPGATKYVWSLNGSLTSVNPLPATATSAKVPGATSCITVMYYKGTTPSPPSAQACWPSGG